MRGRSGHSLAVRLRRGRLSTRLHDRFDAFPERSPKSRLLCPLGPVVVLASLKALDIDRAFWVALSVLHPLSDELVWVMNETCE